MLMPRRSSAQTSWVNDPVHARWPEVCVPFWTLLFEKSVQPLVASLDRDASGRLAAELACPG